MKTNIGCMDRIIRIIVGVAAIVAGYLYHNWWGLLGLIPLLTAMTRFCPLYVPLGLNTGCCKKDDDKPAAPGA